MSMAKGHGRESAGAQPLDDAGFGLLEPWRSGNAGTRPRRFRRSQPRLAAAVAPREFIEQLAAHDRELVHMLVAVDERRWRPDLLLEGVELPGDLGAQRYAVELAQLAGDDQPSQRARRHADRVLREIEVQPEIEIAGRHAAQFAAPTPPSRRPDHA